MRADGAFIYVANTGSNSVAVVDTQRNVTIELIPVGRAPMGVALVEVPAALCAGDCRDRGLVDVADLTQAVAIGLERAAASSCAAADVDGLGTVTVDELLLAVRHALDGCP
jgi:YVTN family beta-propeller protein